MGSWLSLSVFNILQFLLSQTHQFPPALWQSFSLFKYWSMRGFLLRIEMQVCNHKKIFLVILTLEFDLCKGCHDHYMTTLGERVDKSKFEIKDKWLKTTCEDLKALGNRTHTHPQLLYSKPELTHIKKKNEVWLLMTHFGFCSSNFVLFFPLLGEEELWQLLPATTFETCSFWNGTSQTATLLLQTWSRYSGNCIFSSLCLQWCKSVFILV